MSDSNITKKALASSLKTLLKSKDFAKISVGDIAENCEMNRKSFYYHFQDKYDLVTWIFNTEFLAKSSKTADWQLLNGICDYLYQNRDFYKKIICIEGQNSFSEYFKGIISVLLKNNLKDITSDENFIEFYIEFFSDAILCAFKNWLINDKNRTALEFADMLKRCFLTISERINRLPNEN